MPKSTENICLARAVKKNGLQNEKSNLAESELPEVKKSRGLKTTENLFFIQKIAVKRSNGGYYSYKRTVYSYQMGRYKLLNGYFGLFFHYKYLILAVRWCSN